MRKPATPVSDKEIQFIRENLWELGCTGCGRALNRGAALIGKYAKRLGLLQNPEMGHNRADVSCITNLRDPFVIYFLGFFWADGSITPEKKHRIKFKIKSQDFDDLKAHIHRLGDFWNIDEYGPEKSHWNKMTVMDVTHKKLWAFLAAHDYRIKSGASACKILAAISQDLRHYWWRGYFDGDGHIATYRKGGRIVFNSGFLQDWTFVESLGNELGVTFSIERSQRIGRGGSKAALGHSNFVKAMVAYMYQGEEFGLKRKRDRCFQAVMSSLSTKSHSSRFRGVCKRGSRWHMQISTKGRYASRLFDEEVDAARAYDVIAVEWFKNRAILNFPNG